MTDAPATRIALMSLDEFVRRYDQNGPFELIDGEIIPKMPSISIHNKTAKQFFLLFLPFEQQGLGAVFQEATFVLTDNPEWVRGSRIPDVMFVTRATLDQFEQTIPNADNKPYILIPEIVIEVVSPTDHYSDIHQKVKRCLNDGVQIVFVADPQTREIIVHRPGSDQQTTLYRDDDLLTAEPILPGFAVKLADVFG
jgi:Uma2 family endonuclease